MRTTVIRSLLCVTAASALSLMGETTAQLPTESRLDSARVSVVRIDARDCAGPGSVATGFVWGDRSQVVTALHAVAGCGNVSVYYEARKTSRSATVSRVLRRADLALLQVTDSLDVPPLPIAANPLTLHQQATALGYHLNVASMAGTTLTLRYGGKTLRDIVPPSVGAELEKTGSPALDLSIMNFEGHLLPGLSGCAYP